MISPLLLDLFWRALAETLTMTVISGMLSVLFGLPLAVILVTTDRRGILERPWVNHLLGWSVNGLRSLPFIILLVAVIPLTRLLVGTSIGTAAAIVPLSIAAIPYFARIAEIALREVDQGVIEAVQAMGGRRRDIIRHVLIPESLPGLVSGFTVTLVTLVSYSAMAGAVGAGGLGDLAIRFGYQRFETEVMIAVIAVLITLVGIIQFMGDRVARFLDKRG